MAAPAADASQWGMALRLGGLADLDPAAVPLPPGTEVIADIDAASPHSPLPADAPPAAIAALDAWLRDVRRRSW